MEDDCFAHVWCAVLHWHKVQDKFLAQMRKRERLARSAAWQEHQRELQAEREREAREWQRRMDRYSHNPIDRAVAAGVRRDQQAWREREAQDDQIHAQWLADQQQRGVMR